MSNARIRILYFLFSGRLCKSDRSYGYPLLLTTRYVALDVLVAGGWRVGAGWVGLLHYSKDYQYY